MNGRKKGSPHFLEFFFLISISINFWIISKSPQMKWNSNILKVFQVNISKVFQGNIFKVLWIYAHSAASHSQSGIWSGFPDYCFLVIFVTLNMFFREHSNSSLKIKQEFSEFIRAGIWLWRVMTLHCKKSRHMPQKYIVSSESRITFLHYFQKNPL